MSKPPTIDELLENTKNLVIAQPPQLSVRNHDEEVENTMIKLEYLRLLLSIKGMAAVDDKRAERLMDSIECDLGLTKV